MLGTNLNSEHVISRLVIILLFLLTTSTLYAGDIYDVQSEIKKMQTQIKKQQKQINDQHKEIKNLKKNKVLDSHDDNLIQEVSESIVEHEGNMHTSKLKVFGWADVLFQDRDSTNYKPVLNPQHLYLLFDAQLDDNWRMLSELEFEHLPIVDNGTGKGEIIVDRLYIEYNHSDLLNSRVGKISTPLGIWTPAHWAISVPSIQKPIHEDNAYVPRKQVGLESFGRWNSATSVVSDVKYAVWVSTGNDLFGTNNPTDDKFALGTDISGRFSEHLKLGLSTYTQHNSSKGGRREDTVHPYLELYLIDSITVTGEYQHQKRFDSSGDINTWYLSTKWQFTQKAYIYYRRDDGDDERRAAGTKTKRNIITLGYWPRPYVRTKLEFSTHDFEDPTIVDFNQWGAWIGVNF